VLALRQARNQNIQRGVRHVAANISPQCVGPLHCPRPPGGAGIPVGCLFTGAGRPHDPCYHRACDDIDNIDMPILVEMTRAAGDAVERLWARN
jgi:hypothetical protein